MLRAEVLPLLPPVADTVCVVCMFDPSQARWFLQQRQRTTSKMYWFAPGQGVHVIKP